MILRRPAASLLAILLSATAVRAECTVSSDAGAVVRPVQMTSQADATAVISMSMAPKLMHVDYADAVARRPACALGAFTALGQAYQLYGDDTVGRRREALPAREGDPVAAVIPVVDILKAVDASKRGRAAPVDGYLLATLTRSDVTGWRYYSGLPDAAVLKTDMAQALGGGLAPIFRNGPDGKTAIIVPKG